MGQAKPTKLFRFFPPEASDFFSAKKLWFSTAKDFNDVFEVALRYDGLVSGQAECEIKKNFAFLPPTVNVDWRTFKRTMTPLTNQVYEESMEVLPEAFQRKFSEHFGIVCFTENLTSILMWGHYTKGHQGFVVEFDPHHTLFQPDATGKVFGKVVYTSERPRVEVAQERDGHRTILLTKSPEWEYESEHRLVKQIASLERGTRRDGREKFYVGLSPDSVRAVYLGCQMEDNNRNEIVEVLKKPEWQHVSRFVMRRHHSNYAVEPVNLETWKPAPKDAFDDIDKMWKAIGL